MKKLLPLFLLTALAASSYAAFPTNESPALINLDSKSRDWKDYNWDWKGYEDQVVTLTYTNDDGYVDLDGYNALFRAWQNKKGSNVVSIAKTAAEITISDSNITFVVSFTNIPKDGPYKSEVLVYNGTATNATLSAGRGMIRVAESIYRGTNAFITPTYTGLRTNGQTVASVSFVDYLGISSFTNGVLTVNHVDLAGVSNLVNAATNDVVTNYIVNATNQLDIDLTADIVAATNGAVTDANAYTDAATNAIGIIEPLDYAGRFATNNVAFTNMWLSGDGEDEGISIANDGDVGIGTNTPAVKLHVAGKVQVEDNIVLNDNSISGDGDDEGVFVGSDGSVGINQSSPTNSLHVEGDVTICNSTAAAIFQVVSGINGGAVEFRLGADNVEDPEDLFTIRQTDGGRTFFKNGFLTLFELADGETIYNTAEADQDWSDRSMDGDYILFLDAALNQAVIGTNVPTAKLHVSQWAAADSLRIDDEYGDTTPFIIDQSGSAGIKTNTPGATLHVNGDSILGGAVDHEGNISTNTGHIYLDDGIHRINTNGAIQIWNAGAGYNIFDPVGFWLNYTDGAITAQRIFFGTPSPYLEGDWYVNGGHLAVGTNDTSYSMEVFDADGGNVYLTTTTDKPTTALTNATLVAVRSGTTYPAAQLIAPSGSYVGDLLLLEGYRAASTAYYFLRCIVDADSSPVNGFYIDGSGAGYIRAGLDIDNGVLDLGNSGSDGLLNLEQSLMISIDSDNDAGDTEHVGFYKNARNGTGELLATLLESGNFGIGTNAPVAKLHVEGTNLLLSSESEPLVIVARRGDIADAEVAGRYVIRSESSGVELSSVETIANGTSEISAHVAFRVADGFTVSERMRIEGGGNVGIGTNAPGAALHVNGKALIETDATAGKEAVSYQVMTNYSRTTKADFLVLESDSFQQDFTASAGWEIVTNMNISVQRGMVSMTGSNFTTLALMDWESLIDMSLQKDGAPAVSANGHWFTNGVDTSVGMTRNISTQASQGSAAGSATFLAVPSNTVVDFRIDVDADDTIEFTHIHNVWKEDR